jgi:hypothetical protein
MWAQGRFPITQVRRTVLLAENRDCVFAAASDFLLQWAKNRPTAADFILKSAHFVFWTKCAASSRNRLLFCPYIGGLVCKWERQTGPPLKN